MDWRIVAVGLMSVALVGCGESGTLTGGRWTGQLSLVPAGIPGTERVLSFKPGGTIDVTFMTPAGEFTIGGKYAQRGTALTIYDFDKVLRRLMPNALRANMGSRMSVIDMQIQWQGKDEMILRGNAAFAGTYRRKQS